ncbi:MAG: pyruvate kinase, partial [Armatimonadetes bacterium]|nr:pyruvate kinase [Armatimonadota bacterium]
MRKTKIICTIGPSSSNSQTLKDLILAGMDAARLNFSHGTHSEHLKVLEELRKISHALNKPIAVIQDLCGPKVRIGDLKNSQAKLIAGNIFILKTQEILGDENMVSIHPPSIISDLKIGNKILIDDGLIELEIIKIKEEEIYAKVIIGGDLFPHKG